MSPRLVVFVESFLIARESDGKRRESFFMAEVSGFTFSNPGGVLTRGSS